MILHCKNAEMAIYCHFCIFTVQDHTIFLFFIFFLNLAFFYIGGNKKSQKYIFFFFLKCKNLGRRIRKPRNKKKNRLIKIIKKRGGGAECGCRGLDLT